MSSVAFAETDQATDWFSNDSATFGDRLAWSREAVGMTQQDLARRLGVKLKSLQGWEDDTAEPRANKLQMLSGLLNVSIPWLLTGEGEGLSSLDAGESPDIEAEQLLVEMRELRMRLKQDAERVGLLEKRLRSHIRDAVAHG